MKIVASWLFRKVGTLKFPLRAHKVTGTEKLWQCFANAEVTRSMQDNNDRRPIMSDELLRRVRKEGKKVLQCTKYKVAGKEEDDLCEVIEYGGRICKRANRGEKAPESEKAVVILTC